MVKCKIQNILKPSNHVDNLIRLLYGPMHRIARFKILSRFCTNPTRMNKVRMAQGKYISANKLKAAPKKYKSLFGR